MTTPNSPAHKDFFSAFVRYAIPLAALFAAGPLCFTLADSLTSTTGGENTTFLLAASKPSAMLAMVAVLLIAGVFAAFGSWLLGVKGGLIAAGYVFGWAAWGLGDLSIALRATQDLSALTLLTLALEAGVLAVGALALLILGSKADRHPDASLKGISARAFVKELTSLDGLLPVLAAAAAAIIVTVFIAQSGMKGQTVFAALLAGITASIAAHTVSNSETPHPYAPFVGIAIASVVAPLIAIAYPGVGGVAQAAASGDLLGMARLQPADWTVAMLIGVPIGLGWTGTMLSEPDQHAAKAVESSV